MKEKELPAGCTLEIDEQDNKIYVKFGGSYVVTQAIAHYAAVTGKTHHQGDGLPDFVYMKGRKEQQ